jgi:hypothetical protein
MPDQTEDPEVTAALKRRAIAEANNAADKADPSTAAGKIEQQKGLAEAQKAIAEANKGAFDAAYPRGSTTPLEGKIETDDKSGYIAELLGYRAMEHCAQSIADTINKLALEGHRNHAKAQILIVDSLNVVLGDVPLEQVRRQMNLIKTELTIQNARLNSLIEPVAERAREIDTGQPKEKPAELLATPALAIGAVTSVVSQFTDLLSYFRTDYSLKGRTFTISDEALAASVAGKITNSEVCILNFNRLSPSSSADSVMKGFEALLTQRQEVDQLANDVLAQVISPAEKEVAKATARVKQLQAKLDAAKDDAKDAARTELDTEQVKLAGLVSDVDTKSAVVAGWVTSSAEIDTRLRAMLAAGADGAAPPLLQAAAREQTIDMTHLLHVKVSSSGGEAITRRTLWPFSKPEVGYLGGGAVTYQLATKDGQVLAADTITNLTGLQYDVSKLKSLTGD